MNKINFQLVIVAAFLASLAASGCVTFPNDNLAKVGRLPDKSAHQHRPSVYLQAKAYGELLTDGKAPVESASHTQRFKEVVDNTTKNTTLFRTYTMDEFKAREMDYGIKLELQIFIDQGKQAVSGTIIGLTLGIIPAPLTENYRLTVTVLDRESRLVNSFDVEDSVTTWIGILVIPLMGHGSQSPNTVIHQVWENMVRTAYKKLAEQNILRYAQQPAQSDLHPALAL